METPNNRTALITGASSGIGQAFAEEYASKGVNLVIVARRNDPLQKLASRLRSQHGIDVVVWTGDLAIPETPRRLFDYLTGQHIHVDILVNNAGFGVPGNLCEVEWDRHREAIEVMGAAPVRLCYLFAPTMQERRSGWIINVSSLAAFVPPHAGGTLYYPLKSYLARFSIALRAEMKASGVHVTAVCPGFTHTGFQAAAGGTVESVAIPKWMWSEPNDVAAAAIRAVEKNQPICIPGLFNKAVALFFKVIPGALGRKIVGE
ncbi:SDR family NAD(P)-dependent oxidoreductase [Ruegeria profundi]|uniref:SDR family NAD(P)-dependent oxidoreductase n=1 Tax=Ruegeria profundi TaxID=1685378 RepID=UPI001CD7A896|nr:SDR family oxidoreductase [Ruegeria profundi]MCA0927927.1 SDR family oxidoreductase [Ruegeria profundi]